MLFIKVMLILSDLGLPALLGALLGGLGPAAAQRVHEPGHSAPLALRRQKRPLVLGESAHRSRQHLAAKPLHPRLKT